MQFDRLACLVGLVRREMNGKYRSHVDAKPPQRRDMAQDGVVGQRQESSANLEIERSRRGRDAPDAAMYLLDMGPAAHGVGEAGRISFTSREGAAEELVRNAWRFAHPTTVGRTDGPVREHRDDLWMTDRDA
jgi:hypothetical protein